MTAKIKVSFGISEKSLAEVDEHIRRKKFKDRSEFFNTAATQFLGRLALEGIP